jgi:aspartate/methionine/tyrosine aminotransferase
MRIPRRLDDIPGFNIDKVAAAAGDDPDVLRLENLDTDVRPHPAAIEATRAALDEDDANSWLPFNGRDDLKAAVADLIARRGGPGYDPRREIVITCGEGEAMLDALLCLTDPGDEVILTDPTYAGMLNRVRLAGAVPSLVPLHADSGEWRLDLDALRAATNGRTRVVFLNNASFPTGWVASAEEWDAVARLCVEHDLWLLYWSSFEAVLYDGRQVLQPAALPGMRERTVTVGAPSTEQRMIGWRIGWVVMPAELGDLMSRAQIYNGLVASGFGQIGTRVALEQGDDDVAAACAEWQSRRDELLRQLNGLPVVRPHGAWAALLDCEPLGIDPAELSRRLLEQRVAATPMSGWGGAVAARRLRFVFSNEPVERLALLGERIRAALA